MESFEDEILSLQTDFLSAGVLGKEFFMLEDFWESLSKLKRESHNVWKYPELSRGCLRISEVIEKNPVCPQKKNAAFLLKNLGMRKLLEFNNSDS